MTIIVRPATIKDATQIAEIIERAFYDDGSTAQVAQIETCIEDGHDSLVAELDHQVVGFCDGFITTSIEYEKRRELDLQAVHPNYQGQGIGKKLIEHYTNLEIEADVTRALIAVGNHRMEKALTHFGYQPQAKTFSLYISSAIASHTPKPQGSHFIPVNTFTYNGIWLEGEITQQAIEVALSSKKNKQDVVGAVVPVADKSTIELLQSANFTFIKQYRYWYKK